VKASKKIPVGKGRCPIWRASRRRLTPAKINEAIKAGPGVPGTFEPGTVSL
jgi:hypothetical protein